ncbi:MAG: DUF5103 domain-containing protein [Chitinophagaceae bacterium]|nr:DUF5103 domain-containing protein [Chitinophagaceae bacterium]
MYKRYFTTGLLLPFLFCFHAQAQREPDQIFHPNIKTVQLNPYGDQTAYPIIKLNSNDLLQLDFDDMDGDVKNYYYNIELRNADWSAVQMGYFDYAKGYTNQRISNYRRSAQTLTRYTHYYLTFPNRDITPIKAGNYIIKVFLDGDTSRLVFTRRFLVVGAGIAVSAQVQQPFGQQFFRTHQKIQFTVNAGRLNVSYPQQQIKVVILQNNRWDNCIENIKPTVVRNNILEYNTEKDGILPAMREWRWLDLTSFRLLSDRIQRQENTNTAYNLFVTPDRSRNSDRYIYYKDYNGIYAALTNENVNPYWNADYATVHFSYYPPGNRPYPKDLYLIGQITNYGKDEGAKMSWNPRENVYETTLQLKQGYYDYAYGLRDDKSNLPKFVTDETEGNIWEAENQYTLLVYYRELGGRYDQLMNVTLMNSMTNRPGQF